MLVSALVSGLVGASVVNAQLGSTSAQKPFSQEIQDGYNPLKHFGGLGPYTNRQSYGIERETPEQCEVDQVFLLMRHGERYPDSFTAAPMLSSLQKIQNSVKTPKGSLAFLNDWDNFLSDPNLFSQESFSGPYAGHLNAYNRGVDYRARYDHLWTGEQVPIFTSGYERVIDTARKFGEGFFGYNYSTAAAINIIPETPDQGANSLTPTCFTPTNNVPSWISVTAENLAPFKIFAAEADRLNEENPGLNLTNVDVYNLLQFAPFEFNVRKTSPWLDVFTRDAWETFGYANNLLYYYYAGPGVNTTAPIGSVYANATLAKMNEGPSTGGKLFFNFVHDTNITPVLAALGLIIPDKDLPTTYVQHDTIYQCSEFVPMGGHLLLERMTCNATKQYDAGVYVRTIVNEAVLPHEDCQDGPGFSCSLQNYTAKLQSTLPEYATACDVPAEYPQTLSFFWDYNTTTTFNYLKGDIPSQLAGTTWDEKPVGTN
ncbi:acid phosphatase PHO12 [Sugiyamaella lignohabitans]|uniref:Acid phosphatase PHO12 n=1 Tax=Sugiyamaella lignohabitans TaxID=796027 RepID=A0A167D5G6_9ASCO|nr:acid phosphatase PHO12 [Sugiyamaella lignohabitans]ANB12506.1 acid phosphatase PHO12 [Sugiyamaella lignohabitans]